ncbi:MAG TPA: phosphotransferase [Ktedonobacterales bacterium]|jgi:Ser/Thr protein kinase RdoA (MazF antagonist)|nr:phosphotransferase [Ktedonobacterales bacterium]
MTVDEAVAFLAACYGLRASALTPIGAAGDAGRALYRITDEQGRSWVLRSYRVDGRVAPWLGGAAAPEWMDGRAALLAALERRGYPAPRPLPARDGGLVARDDTWCAFVEGFIAGAPLAWSSSDDIRALAEALGRLHTLAPVPQAPPSWWHPVDHAAARALAALGPAGPDIPDEWRALHARFASALAFFRDHRDHADLPVTLIHGDCWPANAVRTSAGHVALIDWECAGLGAAVLDLGGLLADCHPDPAPGASIAVTPEPVAAVVVGYSQYRRLSPAELDVLPDVARFGVAFVGALRYLWARQDGWNERIERSLHRLRARFDAASSAAELAREQITRSS